MWIIFFGSSLIFIFQELIPLLQRIRHSFASAEAPPPTLVLKFHQILEQCKKSKLPKVRGRPLKIRIRTSELQEAALEGVFEPRIVLTTGLLKSLTPNELDAVLAHEIAHHHYGGNRLLILLWFFRALQAFNPVALILFRNLILLHEITCDQFASQLTQKESDLASALNKTHEQDNPQSSSAATNEIRRQADERVVQLRIQSLRNFQNSPPLFFFYYPPTFLHWNLLLSLGVLLWGVQ